MWQKPIKKTIFTLNVDNYAPEITRLTYPYMRHYAQKIRADFYVISERKYPRFSPVYEKLQIYELAQEMGNDWNIYIDSDALVHPDLFDVTNHLTKDTVLNNAVDMAGVRWVYDSYFQRDGRHLASCGWFTIASDWCIDLWHPLDIPYAEALKNIYPIRAEWTIDVEHFIDDYTMSRNIAKFGLKYDTLRHILQGMGQEGDPYLFHKYVMSNEDKVNAIKQQIKVWDIAEILPEEIRREIAESTEPAATTQG